MSVTMAGLLADLAAETAVLDDLLAGLPDDGWDAPTPAVGWAIRDQISHLAYFDDAVVLSATDPDAFRAATAKVLELGAEFPDRIAEQHRGLPPAELLAWFRRARASVHDAFRDLDPKTRLPWYGPEMSAASAATARLMETWAHGQDVADALGVRREPTARLRHVAHIGVRTHGFSFALRGREAPAVPVHVALTAPDGTRWTWGDEHAADRISGPALDFCLLVTQRRHLADTGLVVTGDAAAEWMSIAQAYAGAPGPGRAPGANEGGLA